MLQVALYIWPNGGCEKILKMNNALLVLRVYDDFTSWEMISWDIHLSTFAKDLLEKTTDTKLMSHCSLQKWTFKAVV